MFFLQVEALLQETNTEGALQVLEDLAEITEDLGTPTFPRDLDTAIDLVNQTLSQLVQELDIDQGGIDNVSCHLRASGAWLSVHFSADYSYI